MLASNNPGSVPLLHNSHGGSSGDSMEPHLWLVKQQPPEGAFLSLGLNEVPQTETRIWGFESHRTPLGESTLLSSSAFVLTIWIKIQGLLCWLRQ